MSSGDQMPWGSQTVSPPDHTEAAHARGYREGVRNERARWDAEREALLAVAQASRQIMDMDDGSQGWVALRAALGRLNQETAQ